MSFALSAARLINTAIAPLGVRLVRAAANPGATDAAPPLPIPTGQTRATLLESMLSLTMDRPAKEELEAYGRADCDRFIHTLGLVPDEPAAALEVGGNPYFTTILLKQFRRLDLELTNFFSGPPARGMQHVTYRPVAGGTVDTTFDYWNVNVETDRLPYADGAFDLVLFCEVLEHMTNDPLAAVAELKRVLKPGGRLIVTTPNVARLENVARLIAGENLYDPYSGYGPYGRHNREYTADDLMRLMVHCGFEREIMFTADVSPLAQANLTEAVNASQGVRTTAAEYGQYLFSRWKNAAPIQPGRPSWLYRSYPGDEAVAPGGA
ncbi:MAG: class I SAM-dependent methyltransferase [Janthinobacterium lividum]